MTLNEASNHDKTLVVTAVFYSHGSYPRHRCPEQQWRSSYPTFFANADVAWNIHDAHQLTNPQNATTDADFINVYGGWAKGMEPFVAMMTKLQAGPFHDDHRQTIVEKIRFVRPDVAVVITTIVDRQGDGPSASTRGTFVLSKEQGRWLLNSFQNTQITSPPERIRAPQSQLPLRTSDLPSRTDDIEAST